MAIASGSIAYTGTYTVDENTKTIQVHIEASTFPNLVGAPNQRRIITSITDDEMKFTNPRAPAGVTLEIVWKPEAVGAKLRPRSPLLRHRSCVASANCLISLRWEVSKWFKAPVLKYASGHASAAA